MPQSYIENALAKATTTATNVAQRVQSMLGEGVKPQKTQRLTPQEQLNRFLSMSYDEMLVLKRRHGDQAFNRYLVRMRQLAQEVR